MADEPRIDRHSRLVHRRAIAVEPCPATQDPFRPADDSDPPVPETEQVAGRGQSAIPVRRADRRRVVQRLAGRVHDHERDPARPKLVPQCVGEVRKDGDDARRATLQDAFDPTSAGCAATLHLREHDGQVVLSRDALDAADDLERPLALELMEDHLEEWRPTGRPRRPLIAGVADRGLDPATGVGCHVRAPVDDLGHGRDRDTGLFRDLGYRRGSTGASGLGSDGRSGHVHECTESFDARGHESAERMPQASRRPMMSGWRIDS